MIAEKYRLPQYATFQILHTAGWRLWSKIRTWKVGIRNFPKKVDEFDNIFSCSDALYQKLVFYPGIPLITDRQTTHQHLFVSMVRFLFPFKELKWRFTSKNGYDWHTLLITVQIRTEARLFLINILLSKRNTTILSVLGTYCLRP